jgi:hypothetical protein
MTETQQQAFDRITVIRQLERRTGRSYGPVEKRVLSDLNREDVIAVVDALIAAGGALSGYDTAVTK